MTWDCSDATSCLLASISHLKQVRKDPWNAKTLGCACKEPTCAGAQFDLGMGASLLCVVCRIPDLGATVRRQVIMMIALSEYV